MKKRRTIKREIFMISVSRAIQKSEFDELTLHCYEKRKEFIKLTISQMFKVKCQNSF